MNKRKETKERVPLNLGPLKCIMLAKCEPIKFDNPNKKKKFKASNGI